MKESALAVLLAAQSERLLHNGVPCQVVLHDPEEPIADSLIEQKLDDLPPEIIELVERCGGFSIEQSGRSLEFLEFTRAWSGPAQMLAPRCLELADYDGNALIAEVNRGATSGPVWYACHDPEVLILQGRSLAEYLDRVIDVYRPQRRYADSAYGPDLAQRVWDVHDQSPQAPHVLQADEARASADESVASFASSLPRHAVVFDFRMLRVGEGVSYDGLDPDGQCWHSSDPMLRAVEGAR